MSPNFDAEYLRHKFIKFSETFTPVMAGCSLFGDLFLSIPSSFSFRFNKAKKEVKHYVVYDLLINLYSIAKRLLKNINRNLSKKKTKNIKKQ